MGAKYNCKVDPNKDPYTFYVLNSVDLSATTVNFIMDSNVRTGGEAVKEVEPTEEQKGYIEWTSTEYLKELISQEDLDNNKNLNVYGPVTAMEYLQEATKDWTNVSPQIVNVYIDDLGMTHKILQTFTTNARLPYLSEVGETGCDISGNNMQGSCPLWMIDYLYNYYNYENRKSVLYVWGYWTMSSISSDSANAWLVNYGGSASYNTVNFSDHYGVRPVINVPINRISQ